MGMHYPWHSHIIHSPVEPTHVSPNSSPMLESNISSRSTPIGSRDSLMPRPFRDNISHVGNLMPRPFRDTIQLLKLMPRPFRDNLFVFPTWEIPENQGTLPEQHCLTSGSARSACCGNPHRTCFASMRAPRCRSGESLGCPQASQGFRKSSMRSESTRRPSRSHPSI